MEVTIRRARLSDLQRVMDLLRQVNDVHADGRPDLFRHGFTKYNHDELAEILRVNETTETAMPVFVAVDGSDRLVGYCFCMVQDHTQSNNLVPIRTLYIDDLCIDGSCRGHGIGRRLYDHVMAYAREAGFYNLTLNVWSCNRSAMRFYESLGMMPMKVAMEQVL